MRVPRKRRLSVVPRMPVPVRALWDAASEEEKARAHRMAAVMLQVWLGKMRRSEAAEQLQLTPVRVWQLSQQAVAGMVAGLLKQPRRWRRKGGLPMDGSRIEEEEDPKRLKKENEALRRKLKIAEDVIALLKEFPAQRPRPREATKSTTGPSTTAADAAAAAVAPSAAGTSGEENRGIPERTKKRPGMRRPTRPREGSAGASASVADGAQPNPAP